MVWQFMSEAAQSPRRAAVAFWQRLDGRMLVVWNRRYRGWTFAGGMVEPDESPLAAVVRELEEEAGVFALCLEPLYDAPVEKVLDVQRGQHVHVYRILAARGVPREMELGCPVSWFTQEEFLASCPFHGFYRRMFEVVAVPCPREPQERGSADGKVQNA